MSIEMGLVKQVRDLDDCLGTTLAKEIELTAPVTEELMHTMAADAKLQYFPNFPRPYYRIDRARLYSIQGVIGNDSFHVTFLAGRREDEPQRLVDLIEGHKATSR